MKRLLFTLMTFLSVATTAFGQSTSDIILTGKVLDEPSKESLVGVSIILKGTTKGTLSDVDGMFRLVVKAKDSASLIIVVSFVGFKSKELTFKEFNRSKSDKNIFSTNIFLEGSKTLETVAIIGSRSKPRTDMAIPASMEKLSKKDMSKVKSLPKPVSKSAPILSDKVASKPTAVMASAPMTYETMDRLAVKFKATMSEAESSESFMVVESAKMTTERAVLKDNKTVMFFAEDLIAIPEASHFLKEIENAKAMDKAKPQKMFDFLDEEIEPEPSAGQLTAGEWCDLKNWEFWKKSLGETFKVYQNDWKMNFTQRYSLILRGSNEQPISDATVQLIGTDGLTIWTAKTDNIGRAELFADAFGATKPAKMNVQFGGKTYNLDNIKKVETGENVLKIPAACGFSPTVDIAFVVDATGSMGDEIAYLKAELADVIRQVKRDNQQLSVRLGSVFYRDFNDEYLTRTFPFDKSLKKNVEFIKNQSANGGGDTPEAVEEGLAAAIDSMVWSDNAVTRLLFLVLDAPPHLTNKNIEKLQRLTAKAAEKGIRIIPIAASGVDQNTEYLMKAFAVATGGTYTFLTDDSGIGGGHLKATTEKHDIELLNALLVRLIKQYSSYEACNNLVTEATTGGDTKFGLNFKAYPNPVRDVLNLDLKTAVTDVFITNAQGQIVRKLGVFTEGVQSIDVSELLSGIYFVHFKKESVVCTKKISVVK